MERDTLQSSMHPDIRHLLQSLLESHDAIHGIGTMTCSVYDTAWVASVCKTVGGVRQYVFPSSFLAILRAQSEDGSWTGHFRGFTRHALHSPLELTDSILSTMACLYTLSLHAREPHQISDDEIPAPPLGDRIRRATSSLKVMLDEWRIDQCDAVGFEVLAPGMLDLLANEGIDFDFNHKDQLLKLRNAKLERLSPEMMYKLGPSALLHSLEAFHGWDKDRFDVDKIRHHMVGGSMMASPAATASYLMKAQNWDDDAEAYLRLVVERGEGQGSGRVPSAYPSTNFEVLWVTSTLAEFRLCSRLHATKALDIVAQSSDSLHGKVSPLTGFSAGIEPDLDDSAKASIVMSLAGKPGQSEVIVNKFDSTHGLKTYRGERNPSLSANCNALSCLLVDPVEYESKLPTIKKVLAFIYNSWTACGGNVKDKWNVSPYYTLMLISRSLAELVSRWDLGDLPAIDHDTINVQAVPLLLQCLMKTLESQRADGAWGSVGPYEETAYAVLTLMSLLSLPLPAILSRKALISMEAGRRFLRSRGDLQCEFLWIEKVTYGSKHLLDAYVLAALEARPEALCGHSSIPSALLSDHERRLEEILLVQGQVDKQAGAGPGGVVRVQT